MLGIFSYVNLRGKGSIRCGHDIDSFIAEGAPHFIQIIHGDRSRIECQIGFFLKFLSTGSNQVGGGKSFPKYALRFGGSSPMSSHLSGLDFPVPLSSTNTKSRSFRSPRK
jgi:hypothetical protein